MKIGINMRKMKTERFFATLRMTDNMRKILLISVFIFMAGISQGARLKDISTIEGIQSYQLVGYGLVVGLKGSGDSYNSLVTQQSVKNLLEHFGIFTQDKNKRNKTKNVAAVMVTGELATSKPKGTKVDIKVSSIGDAKSIRDGNLLLTPLRDANGKDRATAQGTINASDKELTTGYIMNGAIVDLPIESEIKDTFYILLNTPDFSSAVSVQDTLNKQFGDSTLAKAMDGSRIRIKIPASYKGKALTFVSEIEKIDIAIDAEEKVVINGTTGTVVSGLNVKVSPVRLNYKDMKIEITKDTPVGEFIEMMYKSGVTETEVLDIIRSLKSSGAIGAQVIII
ncbi:MAG: flagellar basal body P-ring protein FlgI [bacterium]|nr:flagellar basal body P-ring protein FlgI [bacterium]